MEQMRYYYCPVCNIKVETKYSRCTGSCRGWLNKGNPVTYTEQEADALIAQKAAPVAEIEVKEQVVSWTDGNRICPSCKKRYDDLHSFCDDCGMLLETVYEKNADTSAEDAVVPVMQNEEEIIEEPEWRLELGRVYKGVFMKGIPIEMRRTNLLIGREYILANNLFHGGDSDDDSIERVSRYNAVLLVRDGKLYIQYDNIMHGPEDRMAPIYINGTLLERNACRRLTEGDKVAMGTGANINMECCAELSVKKIRKEAESAGELAKILENINRLEKKMDYSGEMTERILNTSNEIKEGLADLRKLQSSNYNNASEYMADVNQHMEDAEKNGNAIDKKTLVDKFLKDCKDKDKLLSILNPVQMGYLESAAFVEVMVRKYQVNDFDYAGVFIFMGKLLENFLHNTVKDLFEKYYAGGWKQIVTTDSGKVKEKLMIGDFTTAAFNAERDGNGMYKKMAEEINKRVKRSPIGYKAIKKDFVKINDVRKIRNESAHSCLEEVLSDSEKVTGISEQSYNEAKDMLINDSFLIALREYYDILIEK